MSVRKRWSLYITSFWFILLGVMGPIVTFTLLSAYSRGHELRKLSEARILNRLKTASNGLSVPLWNFSQDGARKFVNVFVKDESIVSLRVVDQKGNLFIEAVDSSNNSKHTEERSEKIFWDDQVIGEAIITFDLEPVDTAIRYQLLEGLLFGFLEIVSCSLFGFLFLKRRVISRISELSKNSTRIASGQLGEPFSIEEGDEIDDLSRSLENARCNIKNLLESLNKQNESLKSLNDSLQQRVEEKTMVIVNAEKMASLGEMAGGIAHEINNPLAIIIGKVDILKAKLKVKGLEEDVAVLEKISATAFRIATIVKGLRTFSRDGSKDPFQKAKLKDIVSETVALCTERFRSGGVELRLKQMDEVHLNCRPVQMSQVLLNLLNNGFDAVQSLSEKWVEVSIETNSDRIILSITDSGSGLAPEVLAKIMQPFFTTKGVGRGTGLGLSISKGIVEEHGGTIHVNTAHKNTQFVIELPLANPNTVVNLAA